MSYGDTWFSTLITVAGGVHVFLKGCETFVPGLDQTVVCDCNLLLFSDECRFTDFRTWLNMVFTKMMKYLF